MDQKKLALIHIIKKELGLTDDEYRSILRNASGVDTAKDLDEVKFNKLMNYFMRSRHYRRDRGGITLRQKFFIKDLALDLGWDKSHIENFLTKYYHKRQLDNLTKAEASKFIQSLKNVKTHQSAKEDQMKIKNLPDYQKNSIVSKELIRKQAGTVTLFAFDAGEGLSEHTAPFDALIFIVEGEAEISIDSKVNHLAQGEIIIMSANHPHAVQAVTPFKMLLVMIKSPK